MKFMKRMFASTLAFAILLTLFQSVLYGQAAMPQTPNWSYGEVIDKRESNLGFGATYTWLDMNVDGSTQKVHTIEFDPKQEHLELVGATKSGYITGMQKMSTMAEYAEQSGVSVIGGINGDFYEISGRSSGVPSGIFINDSTILISESSTYAFGLKDNGESIYGNVELSKSITINDQTHQLNSINRYRTDNQLVLFTDQYASSTNSSSDGIETVLEVVYGKVASGSTMLLRVTDIKAGQGNTVIPQGSVVLSASGDKEAIISNLQIGDEITAQFQLNEGWEDVTVAIGGSGPLVENGAAKSTTPVGTHPRTALGTKADGTIVMFEVDGRQPGFSEGLETLQVANLLVQMGVVNAINLDGGGSSTIIAKMPGTDKVVMMNSGSDGYERNVGNGLLLVNKAPKTGEAASIVISPKAERVLAGSSLQLQALGQDANYHAAALTEQVSWSLSENMGLIADSGLFTAGLQPATITVTATSGQLTGQATVEIVDELTSIKMPFLEKTFDSSAVEQISVIAMLDGKVVQTTNQAFTWSVEGDIGTIDENGLFTATDESGKAGKIIVSYGDVRAEAIVSVGLPPKMLEDFEGGFERYKAVSGANYNQINASIETNQDFVRSGNASLKLEYDFTGKAGTSGVYLQTIDASNYIEIEGYPEKIGMWVYGDGNTHWLRAQLRDGSGAAFPIDFTDSSTGVNWSGWRYVEAIVPTGKTTPLKVDMPVRYMETSVTKKDTGVIYVDDIRAIYSPINEDHDAPVITSIYPAEQEMVKTATPTIKITAEDFGYDPATHPASTLINPASIRLYVDDVQITAPGFYPPKGEISYRPSEPLSEGKHKVKIAVRDDAGNQTIKEWDFIVNLGSPYYEYSFEDVQYLGNRHQLDIKAVIDQLPLDAGEIVISYQEGTLNNFQLITNPKLTEKNVQLLVDEANGKLTLKLEDIHEAGITSSAILASIMYDVHSSVAGPYTLTQLLGNPSVTGSLNIDKAEVITGAKAPVDFNGDSFIFTIKPRFQLTWDHYDIVKGNVATVQIVDEQGLPVEAASLLMNGQLINETSNSLGLLISDELTETVGAFTIQAVKGNNYSPLMNFVVPDFTGTEAPSNISITMGDDALTSRNVTWHTNPSVKDSVVQFVKKDEFTDFTAENVQTIQGSNHFFTTANDGTFRVHQAQLTGLAPNTAYVYRVGDGDINVSDIGQFTTASDEKESVKLVFFGDSQAATQKDFTYWEATVDAAAAVYPFDELDMVVHAGDMVDTGGELEQWNWWFSSAQEEIMQTTLIPIIGNHEVMSTNGTAEFQAMFNHPDIGLQLNKGTAFSFNNGDAHFVVLNTELGEEGIMEQVEWLEQDLAQADRKWTVVFFHQGPYGSTYVNKSVQQYWVPIFDKYGVDLVMNGHDHLYLRTYKMLNGKPVEHTEDTGTIYVIGGSSGPKFYGLTPYEWQEVVFTTQTQIYTALDITADHIKVDAVTIAGEQVDSFTIEKTKAEAVQITNKETVLTVGKSLQLEATVIPEDATQNKVRWSIVSGASNADITESGLLTALSPGTLTVRASIQGNPAVFAEHTIRLVRAASGNAPVIEEPNPDATEGNLIVEEEIIKAKEDGSSLIELSEAITSITFTQQAINQLGSSLMLTQPNGISIIIPEDMLINWKKTLTSSGDSITLQLYSSNDSLIKQLQGKAEEKNVDIILYSDIISITAILNKNGSKQELDLAGESFILQFSLAGINNKHTLGLFEVLEDGTIQYAGGKVQDNVFETSVLHPGSYVLLSYLKKFADVEQSHWAYHTIAELVAKGILNGISNTHFAPSENVTRAEFTAMIVRLLGLEAEGKHTFSDVSGEAWYANAISAAVEAGLVNGRSSEHFAPNDYIERQEMAVILVRAYQFKTGKSLSEEYAASFTDINDAAAWSRASIEAAYHAGLINGKSNNQYDPTGTGTRAESAAMIYSLLNSK